MADVSLGDDSGPAAANWVTKQIAAYPPLAPLVLVLKVYLRRCGLNEVVQGGLSSYSLTLMVLAHLQEEIKVGPSRVGRGGGAVGGCRQETGHCGQEQPSWQGWLAA